MNFNDSELFISLRSPFARRVRLALLENQIRFKEMVCDVFKPTEELISVNPLVRVPALRLSSGEVLIDSNLILQALYESLPQSPLGARNLPSRIPFYRWQALAAGLAEKTVEYFLETGRPPANQDGDLRYELISIAERIMHEVEATLKAQAKKGIPFLLGENLTQADLDLASALTYFGLRYSEEWKSRYSVTAQYLELLEKRPSFEKTFPPR